MNSTLGLGDTLGRTMVKAFDTVMGVLQKVQTRVEWFAEKVGGDENLLCLLAISAGAIYAAFNFGKLTSMLGTVGKLVGGINLKMLAIAAVIVLLALLIDNFVNFT